jgi:alkanesulfonate monooxygenase SsuD/methylene tetrahydromethanopterin reductase-like flavin-dependent oxidoreductase (luciferase family)
MATMRFGVEVSAVMCEMEEVREAWRRIEDLGFDWISGQDHFYSLRSATAACYEALTLHTALASLTARVRVGCLVYSAGYRHPAVMANALVTIDHLSGGRTDVGVGAGWFQAEYEGYGLAFEPPGVRLRRLKEYVDVLRLLWTQDVADYEGEFYALRSARCDPKPMQPRLPIWIGAKQPRAMALAGRIGDGWNSEFQAPEDFVRSVATVKEAAPHPDRLAIGASVLLVAGGRPVADVLRERFGPASEQMMPSTLHGSAAQITDGVGRYAAAGADWVILTIRPPFDFDELELFATEVIPQFR